MTNPPQTPPPPDPPPGPLPPPRDFIRDAAERLEKAIDGIDFDEELMQQIVERPMHRSTLNEALYLLSTIPAAIVASVVWSAGLSLAFAFAIIVIGLPITMLIFWGFRRCADVERARLRIVDDRPVTAEYAPQVEGNAIKRAVAMLVDGQSWKDVGWFVFVSTIGAVAAVLALSVWVVAIGWTLYPLFGWSLPGDWVPIGWIFGDDMTFFESFFVIPFGIAMAVVATWVCAGTAFVLSKAQRAFLSTGEEKVLRGRVTQLERTRDESLVQQGAEMSRIERDLHDGAQARLVALAMDLGMAEQKFEDDPEAARQLVAEARDEAQRTLQELRDLVRGIGPQILRDRGLKAALEPLAARSPIPVDLSVDLPERPTERVETAAYFVASETLANAIKHSEASQININVWTHDQWFYVRVSDNGVGGAKEDGEGLRGLRARIEAVDGRLMVDSPSGGPTIIDAWLPMK